MKKYDKFLRNIEKMNYVNDGTRSLTESIISPEVISALNDWINNQESNFVLIGLSLSYYVKPRFTVDVDVLFLSSEEIPDKVDNFKRNRKSAYQHNKTHVEIELITPQLIDISLEFAKSIFDTSIMNDGIKIASPSGIIALKLGRFSLQDQSDMVDLTNYEKNIDLLPYN